MATPLARKAMGGAAGHGGTARCPPGTCDLEFDTVQGMKVCQKCGYVAQDSVIESDDYGDPMNSSYMSSLHSAARPSYEAAGAPPGMMRAGAQLDAGERNRRRAGKARTLLKQVAQSLGLSDAMCDQIEHQLMLSMEGSYKTGRASTLMLGACIHMVTLNQKCAVTIDVIARALDVAPNKLGMVYRQLREQQKAATPAHSKQAPAATPEAYIKRAEVQMKVSHPSVMAQIKEIAQNLIKIAAEYGFVTGRTPAPIAGAALILASRAFSGKKARRDGKLEDKDETTTFDPEYIASIFGCGKNTIIQRIDELRKVLLRVASSLPWAQEITSSTLDFHLKFILNNLIILHKTHVNAKDVDRKPHEVAAAEAAAVPITEREVEAKPAPWELKYNPFEAMPVSYRRNTSARIRRVTKHETIKERLALLSELPPVVSAIDPSKTIFEPKSLEPRKEKPYAEILRGFQDQAAAIKVETAQAMAASAATAAPSTATATTTATATATATAATEAVTEAAAAVSTATTDPEAERPHKRLCTRPGQESILGLGLPHPEEIGFTREELEADHEMRDILIAHLRGVSPINIEYGYFDAVTSVDDKIISEQLAAMEEDDGARDDELERYIFAPQDKLLELKAKLAQLPKKGERKRGRDDSHL